MALFVFGAFLLLQQNLQELLKAWGDELQINAYLDKSITPENIEELLRRTRGFPEVERVRYISREQAWNDFRVALGAQSGLLEGLPRDVLPSSLEIWIKPAFRDSHTIEQVANLVRAEPGVATVEYPQEWIEKLSLVVLAVQWIKWILAGVLFIVTFFIVGSTVRLGVLARKDEIEIMQLVGASEEMIQAPFVLEGMIQGVGGGVAAIACLWSGFQFLRLYIPGDPVLFSALRSIQFLDRDSLALIPAIGWVLGATGSLFSLRRFMKKWRG